MRQITGRTTSDINDAEFERLLMEAGRLSKAKPKMTRKKKTD